MGRPLDRRGLELEIQRLRKKVNAAIIPGETAITKNIKTEIKQYFEGERFTFETPLHFIGSAFQKQVWEQLKQIPTGETRSYLEIAKSINAPRAFRAVARANGANQLAIVVPCHRVINANGNLGGYGGGLSRKQWLLNHERSIRNH